MASIATSATTGARRVATHRARTAARAMGVFDRAPRETTPSVAARARAKAKAARDAVADAGAATVLAGVASLVGAFLLGRASRGGDGRARDDDTLAALLKRPYMREPDARASPKGLRGALAKMRGETRRREDAATRVRALELAVDADRATLDARAVNDVEMMLQNEMLTSSAMLDVAALEAKLERSLNESDWLLDQSVDETPGKLEGARAFGVDDAMVTPIASFANAMDDGAPSSLERTASKLEI